MVGLVQEDNREAFGVMLGARGQPLGLMDQLLLLLEKEARMRWSFVAQMSLFMLGSWSIPAPSAAARTIWSGSFIPASVESEEVRVGINWPRPERLCGIELKSWTMILHPLVWRRVVDRLQVTAVNGAGREFEVLPLLEAQEGARLSWISPDLQTDWIEFRVATKYGGPLSAAFSAAIHDGATKEDIVIVARDCP